MEHKQLLLSTVGNASLHKEWIAGNKNFDVILIYYGGNDEIFADYQKDAMICLNQKGQKYPMIKQFILNNLELINQYEYIWLPDDDISISTDEINKFFDIARQYNIVLCQPALIHNPKMRVSHKLTVQLPGYKLRYTNFIEGMAPLFTKDALLLVSDDFEYSDSGWGLDVTWSTRLGNPTNKIAIIDETPMDHTRQTGNDYSRLHKHPEDELTVLLKKHGMDRTFIGQIKNYSFIAK